MRIALVKVHYSWLRPFTYLNVSGTYVYTASDKLTCEYMSSLRHGDFNISGDDSRPWNSSCVERIDGGRDTHLYKTSRFGQGHSGNQMFKTCSGE